MSTTTATHIRAEQRATEPNPEKLQALHGQVLNDCNAGLGVLLAEMGDRLGIFRTMTDTGPVTSQTLARHTELNERNLREWLAAMAAAGYVDFDPATETFALSPEQEAVLSQEGHPAGMLGPIGLVYSLFQDEPKLADAFRHGRGLAWGDHNACLFCSTNRFFGPLYRGALVQDWLPNLDGVVEKLEQGADVADVGCGGGTSSIILAQAFPNARIRAFDVHDGSIADARRSAEMAGVADRVVFEVGSSKDYSGSFDLICIFDALHDMGDPVGAAAYAREHLKPGGTLMVVEPYAEDRLQDNLTSERAPVSRFFYNASTLACVPASQAQEVGAALGAQAGKTRLTAILKEAGFETVRIAAETPINLILEARD